MTEKVEINVPAFQDTYFFLPFQGAPFVPMRVERVTYGSNGEKKVTSHFVATDRYTTLSATSQANAVAIAEEENREETLRLAKAGEVTDAISEPRPRRPRRGPGSTK